MEFKIGEKPLDKWEVELQRREQELKSCQMGMGVKSCLECSKLLDCEVRDTYVRAVYSSMNRGVSGGFEF